MRCGFTGRCGATTGCSTQWRVRAPPGRGASRGPACTRATAGWSRARPRKAWCGCGGTSLPEDLAGIEDAVGIERTLDGAHQIQLHGLGVALELRHFQPADAVLGAEAAAEIPHQVVNGTLDRLLAREEGCAVGARGLVEIEVEIAVTDVAV